MSLILLAISAALQTAPHPPAAGACELHLWGVRAKQIGGSFLIKVTPAPTDDKRPTSIANATNPIQRLNAYTDEQLRSLVPFASTARIIRHDTLLDRSYLKNPIKAFAPKSVGCELDLLLSEVSYRLPPKQSKGLVVDSIVGGPSMRSAYQFVAFQDGRLTLSYRDAVSSPIKYAPGAWDVDQSLAVQDMDAASLRNLTQFTSAASNKSVERP